MSRSRFAERFQSAFGTGAMAFLQDLRLARAARMPSEGCDPVSGVAPKVCFSSRSAFTRA